MPVAEVAHVAVVALVPQAPAAAHAVAQVAVQHRVRLVAAHKPVVVAPRSGHVAKNNSNRPRSLVASKYQRVMATPSSACVVGPQLLTSQNASRQIQRHL